jgi:quercetin dioxygenase-like cupin family protein
MQRAAFALILLGVFGGHIGCSSSETTAETPTDSQGQLVPLSKDKETISLRNYAVQPDKALGASVARIGEGRLHQVDVTLIEIPPGGQMAPHRHLAEEMVYIVSGKGYTTMWTKSGERKERYDWTEGDMLSPTLNAWHQHVNASPDTPARYLSLTTEPLTRNVFPNPAFLSTSDFVFDERWKQSIAQQPEYTPVGTDAEVVRMRVGHHLPNLPGREMRERRKDVLGLTIRAEGDMAGNRIMEWEVREYQSENAKSPGHRHFWETVYYIIDGEGYAVLQREGEEAARRVNWTKGDLFIVEANEFHEHRANKGSSPRFWQVKPSGYFHNVGIVSDEE